MIANALMTPFILFMLSGLKATQSFLLFRSSLSRPSSFSPILRTTTTTSNTARTSSYLDIQVVHSMPEWIPTDLQNKYYLLRHGQSSANVASIISSARTLAYSDKHGLTPLGYQQGKESAANLIELLLKENATSTDKIILVSSPFARARQTAQACLEGLEEAHKQQLQSMGIHLDKSIVLHDGLVERHFGRLDGQAIYTYAYVWPLDKFNVTHTAFDVESVAAVCTRIRNVVLELDAKYSQSHIVLVSHADVLQIAQLYAARATNVGDFSSYRFKNGEVRCMKMGTTDHLPQPAPLEAPQRGTRV